MGSLYILLHCTNSTSVGADQICGYIFHYNTCGVQHSLIHFGVDMCPAESPSSFCINILISASISRTYTSCIIIATDQNFGLTGEES